MSENVASVDEQKLVADVEAENSSDEAITEEKNEIKKASLPKLKIEGVFQCLTCGKLLTKAVAEDKTKAFCNCCNVTYFGNL